MPEVVKQYLTVHDLKLIFTIVAFMASGFAAWNNLKGDVTELKVRREVLAEQSNEQVKATKELTKAVQNLNITSVQLEARLRNLEQISSSLQKTVDGIR